jgi:predicted metal-dependent hydrolase
MHELTLADGRRIPYRIRVSTRSKRVRLTLNPRDGLVLVTPPGIEDAWLMELAQSWHHWVSRQLDRMGLQDQPEPGSSLPRLPDRIELPAVGEAWDILFRYAPSGPVQVRESGNRCLILRGDSEHTARSLAALRRWLMRRAAQLLPPWLEVVSEETGLSYGRVSIRAQRTRWGSCSSSGDINLNYQLLFLPRDLARHVLVHELCHTLVMDHSPRFWRTMARHEPDLLQLRARMKHSWSYVPAWVSQA